VDDRGEPSDDHELDAFLVKDLADPDGVEHQRCGLRAVTAERADRAVDWTASSTFAASTIVRTRSATGRRRWARI